MDDDHRALRRSAAPVRRTRRLCPRRPRPRSAVDGLSFCQEMMDGDVGKLSGGWKMRVALARILLMRPDAHAARRTEQPSRSRKPDLARAVPARAIEGALLMTSHDREFMNRIVTKIIEIDARLADHLFRQLRILPAAARHRTKSSSRPSSSASRRCSPRNRTSSSASRPAPPHAAQVQSRVKKLDKIDRVEPPKRRQTVAFEFPPAPALRRGRGHSSRASQRAMARRSIYDGLDFHDPPRGALVHHGHQRRRQVDAC